MQKVICLIMSVSILAVCVSACTIKQSAPIIKSQRRFAQYLEPEQKNSPGVVDLSEGPKLKYEASFGPKSPSFDFKIENPY